MIADSIRHAAPKWNAATVETMTANVMVGLLRHFGDIRIHRAKAGEKVAIVREGLPLPAGPYRRLSSEWTRDVPPEVYEDDGRPGA